MSDCNDCPVLPRVEALEEANRDHGKRLGDLEKATAVQDTLLTTMDDKLEDIKINQKSILQKVETLEAKPGKRWDSFGEKVLWFLAEAVLIIAALKIGLM